MISIEIKDCQLTPGSPSNAENDRQHTIIQYAASILNDKLCSGDCESVTYFSLTGRKMSQRPDFVLGCQAEGMSSHSYARATRLLFTTSTYVGQAIQAVNIEGGGVKFVKFNIRPHIGKSLDAYLLQHACGVLLPNGMTASVKGGVTRNVWLLALMWRCAFEKARRESFLPKAYVVKKSNGNYFKGRLDVNRQIRDNLTDATKLACVYKELSADSMINRTIRRIRRWFVEQGLTSGLGNLEELDQLLASIGVQDVDVQPDQIEQISYTRMTEAYHPVMRLSKLMLAMFGGAASAKSCGESSAAYFVDYSEVWENYLLSIMKKELGKKYSFVSPNDLGAEEKLVDSGRMLRPDFLVYDKHKRLVAVLDAKYKYVSRIGCTGDKYGNVSRDDLYQMATYLYHYSKADRPISGIFLTCGEVEDEGMQEVSNRAGHYVGVCAFPLAGIDEDDEWSAVEVEKEMKRRSLDFCHRLDICISGKNDVS